MLIIKYIGTIIAFLVVIIFIGLLVKKDKSTTPNYQNKQIKNVKVQNPENETAELKDQYRMGITFDGNKSQITDLIEGKATFNIIYPEEKHFTANILKPDGTLIAVLNDTNGPFKVTRTINIPETGSYILDVKTTGKWSFSRN